MPDLIDIIFIRLVGKKPNKKQSLVLKSIFEELWQFEDPIEPPSSAVALMASVSGQNLAQVLSSSINVFGGSHFCFEDIHDFIRHPDKASGSILPGFGHVRYKHGDPRVNKIIDYCAKIGYKNKHIDDLISIGHSNGLFINTGGLLTCILIDCGCDRHNVSYFPIICRMLGLTSIHRSVKIGGVKFSSSYEVIKRFNRVVKK